jgi:two-component system response regulator (stage 0 sporulation protein F)
MSFIKKVVIGKQVHKIKTRQIATTRSPMRVLLAEDDEHMRGLIALKLRKIGFEVLESPDGKDLTVKIEKLLLGENAGPSIHIIISDIRMPGCSGIDVLARLRSAGNSTPFVLITAFGDYNVQNRAAELGASALFDKPFDLDELCRTVLKLHLEDRKK